VSDATTFGPRPRVPLAAREGVILCQPAEWESHWKRGEARVVSPRHPLDNAVWSSLCLGHARFADLRGRARMYQPDVSVFAAVDQFDATSWNDLAALVGPAGPCVLFCAEVPRELPIGWTARIRGRGRQMILEPARLADVEPVSLRRLARDDVPQMLDLVAKTNPGPFRLRTVEMGRYYGHFEGTVLCAMAGERLTLDGYTEISAVCTLPDARGRGWASALTHHVAAGIVARGAQPFLHVAESNEPARRLYQRLGFTERRTVDFAMVQTPPT
jgi:predicted GNAT family acetyltransferase